MEANSGFKMTKEDAYHFTPNLCEANDPNHSNQASFPTYSGRSHNVKSSPSLSVKSLFTYNV